MTRPDAPAAELVVLVDPAGEALGTAPKATVHHADTPLHLAFSCYVVDPDGRLLVTRRALSKATFPGVWTNSLCGHPGPGERMADAVVRRGRQELGLDLVDLRLLLPRFGYRAEQDGVVEHELCPVWLARTDGPELHPDPAEVAQARWMRWPDLRDAALGGEPGWSSWCREQVPQLAALGPGPASWPAGDPADLPPAARLG